MSRFLEALHSGRVLLMDGAMGTELQRAGIQEGDCYELWNLTHPEIVTGIHRSYVEAGAECILTNTFQANPPALEKRGLGEKLEDINAAGVALAGSVAGLRCFVMGDIGPLENREGIDRVLASMRTVDAYLFETLSKTTDILFVWHACISAAKAEGIPVVASFSFNKKAGGGKFTYTLTRAISPERIAKTASKSLAALGVNCGPDITLDDMIAIIRQYRKETDLPLFARPNAGTPTRVGSHWVYPHTPAMMAERLPELLEAGVSMIGGCCGTTPEHIAAFRAVIAQWNARREEYA